MIIEDQKRRLPLIQVTEDNDFMRRILLDCLRGFECVYSTDIKNSMEVFIDKRPDIVFLDLILPDGNSLDIIPRMKQINDKAYIYVVSADISEKSVNRAMAVGAKSFISKPYSKSQIHECIKQFVADCSSKELSPK